MSKPQSIADLITAVFEPEHQWKIQLMRNWHTAFGTLSDKVYLDKIEHDTLTLVVHDACWMHELYSMSSLLLAAINEKLDKPYIKRLRFIQGGKRTQPKVAPSIAKRKDAERSVTLTDREQKALTEIKDPVLACAMHDFLVRCYHERGE